MSITPPNEWFTSPLGDLARVYSGGTPLRSVPAYWGGRIPWVTTAEVDGGLILSAREAITDAGLNASATRVASQGTLLLAMYGQGKTRGKVAMLGIAAAMNQACAAIETGRCLDARYLFHYLTSQYDAIRSMSNAGSQENLSGELVRKIPVLVPPIPEQRAISQVLGDADELISALLRKIHKKQAIKQGMMQQLLTGKTRLPGFTAEWVPVRLGDAGSTYGGLAGKSKDDFGTGSATFVTFMEVMAGARLLGSRLERVRVGHAERQNRLLRGDILFNGSSETPEEVALAAAVDYDPSPSTYLNSFCFGYRLKVRDQIDPTYLAYFFRSAPGREIVSALAQGATRYNIAKTKLMQVAPILPPINEQRTIVEALSSSEAEINALDLRLRKARAIKTGMMQELLTGRTQLPIKEVAA